MTKLIVAYRNCGMVRKRNEVHLTRIYKDEISIHLAHNFIQFYYAPSFSTNYWSEDCRSLVETCCHKYYDELRL